MRIEYPSGKDYPKIVRTDIVYYNYISLHLPYSITTRV